MLLTAIFPEPGTVPLRTGCPRRLEMESSWFLCATVQREAACVSRNIALVSALENMIEI